MARRLPGRTRFRGIRSARFPVGVAFVRTAAVRRAVFFPSCRHTACLPHCRNDRNNTGTRRGPSSPIPQHLVCGNPENDFFVIKAALTRCGISPSRGRNICGARNRSSKPHFMPDTCAEDMAEPPGPNYRSHRSKRRKRRIRARDQQDRLQFAISRSASNFSGQFTIRNFRNPQEVDRILVWIHSNRYCADMGARAVPVCQNESSEASRAATSALQGQGSENLRNAKDGCGSKRWRNPRRLTLE